MCLELRDEIEVLRVNRKYTSGECYAIALRCYKNKEYSQAARWCKASAERCYSKAQYMMGLLHACGKGIPKNDAEALKWFKRAAQRGNADAMYALGMCYLRGKGINAAKSKQIMGLEWVIRAARCGSENAIRHLKARGLCENANGENFG